MPDPTPTDRDHALARSEYAAWTERRSRDVVTPGEEGVLLDAWARTIAQARREGREEGIREAEIRGAVGTLERLQEAGYFLHDRNGTVITAPEFLEAVLAALPAPEGEKAP